MILLIAFAFLAGIVTILSPCILPILPIVLSGTVGSGKKRPLGIVTGFVLSFTFFTLFLSILVKVAHISPDILRSLSIVIILIFGLSLLIPKVQIILERLFSQISGKISAKPKKDGFQGGIVIGLSLGLLWTPCVGPILASVITLAATSSITFNAILITFAYALGTAIPMFAIMYGGRQLLQKVPWLLPNSAKIQKVFGVLMVITALGIFFNIDRTFQTFILEKFPQYGTGLTKIEDNSLVKDQLQQLQKPAGGNPLQPLIDQQYPQAPELIAGGEWFNSKPLTMASLKGKVVLVDFWTYTCINCIRTLPYIQAWNEKYKDKGLVIIGVHTPEFEFEKNPQNVKKAIADFGLTYPIMQDNDYATWNAYSNQYWPAKYFIDKNGKVRSTHFGEGNYDESEKMIQDLLKETGAQVDNMTIHNQTYEINARTPETYLGYARIDNNSSPESLGYDKPTAYSFPKNLGTNKLAYGGTWTLTAEQARPAANSSLEFNFNAQDVYLVMRSHNNKPGKVHILLDGKEVSTNGGKDVVNGIVTVTNDKLYHLIHLQTPGTHILKIEFLDNNLELYAFTFG